MLQHKFKYFAKAFEFREVESAIEFYGVFGGAPKFCEFNPKNSLIEEIEISILRKYPLIKYRLNQIELNEKFENLLHIVANNDNRDLNALKKAKINEFEGKDIYNRLFELNILKREFSREKPIVKIHPKQKLKREYRRYRIENRVKFKIPFLRFYFTFLYPHKELIEEKRYDEVLTIIEAKFEEYISFTFEDISNEFIMEKFNLSEKHVGGYWDKKIEVDLLANAKDSVIIGECKWKNHKICKNILNTLKKKCKISNLQVDKFALFSKSGFSKELEKEKDILLYDLNAFKGLL